MRVFTGFPPAVNVGIGCRLPIIVVLIGNYSARSQSLKTGLHGQRSVQLSGRPGRFTLSIFTDALRGAFGNRASIGML